MRERLKFIPIFRGIVDKIVQVIVLKAMSPKALRGIATRLTDVISVHLLHFMDEDVFP